MGYGRAIASGMGGVMEDEELQDLGFLKGLGNRWNAGWARHYAAGGPTPGQMGQAYQYGRAITSGMGGVMDEEEQQDLGFLRGLGRRWNAGWARHYAAGGPTP